jgi:CheY-like chemotaxis protein
VENDPVVQQHFSCALQQQGHALAAAGNGGDALELLRAGPPPDLICLDADLPRGDAEVFLEALSKERRLARVPVVVMRGAGVPTRSSFPVSGFLDKPLTEADLTRAIQQWARPRRPQILVVEDHADILQLMEQVLHYFGFGVWLAPDGRQAADLYCQHKPAIDLVLMDVQMVPVDGPQTLAALRKIDAGVRIAFMSGNTGKYTADDLLAMGALRVFAKPFDLPNLIEQLWELVEQRPL